jgi:hypothetical protein
MKGMVFTEFLEMVEGRFSADMVDDIIADAQPPSGGAYTAVGVYDHAELVSLVVALAGRTGHSTHALVHGFGRYLFDRFLAMFPHFFEDVRSALDFLEGIEAVIHTEVRKLYPDVQLPSFECERSADRLSMVYRSPRHLGDLAEGLIHGAVAHFGDNVDIARRDLPDGAVEFRLTTR